MPSVFPDPIRALPLADIPLPGARACISQSEEHQVLFMEFEEDVVVPEHTHEAQWGIVLEGRIDLTVEGVKHTYTKGDRYFIPAGAVHGAQLFADYADITFFAQRDRYKRK
ncbi:MAG TPA: cupin domain-containing protein [Bacteroidetes bacterium]|nr:cupin domain-containing protein [Bacteroidota bacterium]